MNKCIACGTCAEKCPRKVANEYNAALDKRKAIYVQYAQAVPLKYTIDAEHCIYFEKGKCKACEKFCPTGAIDFADQEKELSLKVGAVVIAPGANVYDPAVYDVYGYKRFANVVTSLEFERMLSATGPYGGHLLRPADGKEPEKIGWLQCVGSRDIHPGTNPYCSGVCCTYAIKEAIVAKEHLRNLAATVFYIDIRTHGKDFEKYYNRAKEMGVRFVRARIGKVRPADAKGNLRLCYTNEAGARIEEDFDLLVLSVGLQPAVRTKHLASTLDILLDQYGFVETPTFKPVSTSRGGIYICGTANGPKDIPDAVMEASAAACAASCSLAKVRGTLAREKPTVPLQEVSSEKPRIGVFVCNCGVNIGGVVRVPEVVDYAKNLPNVAYAEENLFSCSQDVQEAIRQVIIAERLNRIVVAACSPRTHEPLFRETLESAGLSKYLFEMANIRNQDSWVHQNDPDAATLKAKDLVRMAVAKAALLAPLEEQHFPITQTALVVGGGLAGMQAALSIADSGFAVHLVEKTAQLGGQANHIQWNWKGQDVQAFRTLLEEKIRQHPLINIHLGTEIDYVNGFVGNFRSTLRKTGSGRQAITVEHGVIVLATGARPYKPEEHLYGKHPHVFIWHELDELVVRQDPTVAEARCGVFIQCVGSRNQERPYCSRICCSYSLTAALKIKKINPRVNLYILYRDIRTYGLREDLYAKARSQGIMFIRYDSQNPPKVTVGEDGALEITVVDQVLRRLVKLQPDFINLASAIVPSAVDELARILKVAVNQEGFFQEAHVKLRPVDFATDGIFVCGLAHYPKDVDESLTQAMAAASRAVAVLAKKQWVSSGQVARIDETTCVGCQGCAQVCPYGAVEYVERERICQVNVALCKGCGSCAAACPSGSARLLGFERQQLHAQITAFMQA